MGIMQAPAADMLPGGHYKNHWMWNFLVSFHLTLCVCVCVVQRGGLAGGQGFLSSPGRHTAVCTVVEKWHYFQSCWHKSSSCF